MKLLRKLKPRIKFKKFKKPLFKLLTIVFYGTIGLAASLLLFLILYRVLRLDSSITTLVAETISRPFYLSVYANLTFATIVLFGVNASLFFYRLRKYGLPRLRTQTGAGFGSVLAIAASACPVCGSTLLSAVGVAGGLASLPFSGLELKALSFGLMALPVGLMIRDIRRRGCVGRVCPAPRDASFGKKDGIWLTNIVLSIVLLSLVSWNMLKYEPLVVDALAQDAASDPEQEVLLQAISERLFPKEGVKTSVVVGDVIPQMVTLGIIDLDKLQKLFEGRGGIGQEIMDMLTKTSDIPLTITQDNQSFLVTLLWPLGLANKMDVNRQSQVAGSNLFNFASTGGWTLGKERNGGAYFNKYELVPLTSEQEVRVRTLAENIYRPCCNNSAFFQDCNHGSAALAIIELGVAAGQSDEEIYKNVLVFNSYWFSGNYLEMALYFEKVKGQDFASLSPAMLLSQDYSSGSGWAKNVHSELAKIPGFAPTGQNGSGCGI